MVDTYTVENRPLLKNLTNQKVSFVGLITLYVQIPDCRVRVAFGVIHSFAIPVLLGTWSVDSFLKNNFLPGRKILSYNPRPVLVFVVIGLSEGHKDLDDKAQVVMNKNEEHAPHLICLSR